MRYCEQKWDNLGALWDTSKTVTFLVGIHCFLNYWTEFLHRFKLFNRHLLPSIHKPNRKLDDIKSTHFTQSIYTSNQKISHSNSCIPQSNNTYSINTYTIMTCDTQTNNDISRDASSIIRTIWRLDMPFKGKSMCKCDPRIDHEYIFLFKDTVLFPSRKKLTRFLHYFEKLTRFWIFL